MTINQNNMITIELVLCFFCLVTNSQYETIALGII